MMKQRSLFFKTTLLVLLSIGLLSVGMLHIFASDLPTQNADNDTLAPDVTLTSTDENAENTETSVPSDVVVNDGTVPLTQAQLNEKFSAYTHITEEDGKSVVTLFTAEQIAQINAKRESGETMLLNGQEMLYLLDDTKRLFETYDIIRVTDLDGTVYSYPGISFYSSEEFAAAFSGKIGTISDDKSYDLKNDAYEAMIYRIKVLHSYAEYICYREDEECMYTYTEWDGIEGVDPRMVAEGINRCSIYSLRFEVAQNYAEGDIGDDNGKHPEIPVYRLNLIRSTPGAMLVFFDETIYYIADMSAFDGTNMTILYPDGIFPGGTVTGKYENGDGRSVVIELWEEASAECIARIRLTEQNNAAEVAKIAELWNGMKHITERGGTNGAGKGAYRVAVYLCGFDHEINAAGDEQNSFWYTPDADTDLWSLIWWDNVMNFFSDNFVGGSAMAEYINSILQTTLTAQ